MKKQRNRNIMMVIGFIIIFVVVWLLLTFVIGAAAETNVNVQPPGPARLPAELTKIQVKWMAIGDIGYQAPNAMIVDEGGRCYLGGTLTIEPGNKNMNYGWIKIERKKDGYYVYVLKGEKTLWAREYIPYQRDKFESRDLIPVKDIVIIKVQ